MSPVTTYRQDRERRERNKKQEARRKRGRELDKQHRDRNVLGKYQKDMPPVHLTGKDFRWRAIRKERRGRNERVNITNFVTACDWQDSAPVLTGTISLQQPKRQPLRQLKDGNVVICEIRWGGRWREIWRMRVYEPEEDVGIASGTYALADDLRLLALSEDDFLYKKSKKDRIHKNGWKPQQVVVDILRRYKVPKGKLAQSKTDVEIEEHKASPLSVLIKAYEEDTKETGRTYIFRWHRGRLNITKLTPQPMLYTLRQQILNAVIHHQRGKKFYTALHVTANRSKRKTGGGNDKTSRKKEKIEIDIVSPKAVQQYGFIRGKLDLEREYDSEAKVRKIAKRALARQIRRKTTDSISLSHPGIPWIRRGHATRILLPEYGFTDKPRPRHTYKGGHYSILFVTSASHTVNPGGQYTMDLEFSLTDPIAESREGIREARDKERRKKARKRRKDRQSEQ